MYFGDIVAMLRTVSPLWQRYIYVACLYAGALVALVLVWRRCGPRLSFWPPDLAGLGLGLVAGIGGVSLHRVLLIMTEQWQPFRPDPWQFAAEIFIGLALAAVEEGIFRGYVFGVAKEECGRVEAYAISGLLFAAVHMFRPGSLLFKVCFFVGLFLCNALLCRFVERTGSLYWSWGVHAGAIALLMCEPAHLIVPSLWSGLEGELCAGMLGWFLLIAYYWRVSIMRDKQLS